MRNRAVLRMAAAGMMAVAMMAAPGAAKAQGSAAATGSDTVLKPAEMQKLLPPSVYYRGQTATTQLRNSGGVKFADGFYVLATKVDTGGYATGVAEKYQAYFITEVPLKVGGENLAAGVYGVGFIGDNKFAVTDVGGHDVLSVNAGEDAGMKRPMPLEIVIDPGGGFRLYAGRKYVLFSR
ncbi:MAG: hypothetical protein ACLP7O_05670 [Terracidiphilus sp.]